MNSAFYRKSSAIIEALDSKNNITSFKSVVYNFTNPEDTYFKKIYCVCIEVHKYKKLLDRIINSVFTDRDYQSMNVADSLFKILLYEKFLSKQKKLKMGGKVIKLIKSKDTEINTVINDYKKENNIDDFNEEDSNDKIYFRILDLYSNKEVKARIKSFATKDSLIKNLYYIENERNNKNDNKENKAVGSINSFDIKKKEVFKLRDKGYIKIQSKSSCLPPYILKQYYNLKTDVDEENSANDSNDKYSKSFDILDSCSAPGNKTIQLADYFFNQENKDLNIFAFEKNKERYETLLNNIQLTHPNNDKNNDTSYSNIIKVFNQDFLNIDPKEKQFSNIEYAVCDPSCSGSGTLTSLIEDPYLKNNCCLKIANSKKEEELSKSRLNSLSLFQEKIILHAMKFPNIKAVIYSTCSVYYTENENVVERVLNQNKNYKLFNIHSLINNDEEDKELYHKGLVREYDNCCNEDSKLRKTKTQYCLRACNKCFKEEGFFVALFVKKNE